VLFKVFISFVSYNNKSLALLKKIQYFV
jgi:hypothetical protein